MCLQLFLNITQRDCGERCPRGGSESRRLRAQHGRDQAPVRAGTLAASAVHGRARPNAAPLREGRGGAAALQAGARAADHVCGVAVAAPQVSRKLAETILGARGLSRGGRGPGSAGSGVTLNVGPTRLTWGVVRCTGSWQRSWNNYRARDPGLRPRLRARRDQRCHGVQCGVGDSSSACARGPLPQLVRPVLLLLLHPLERRS